MSVYYCAKEVQLGWIAKVYSYTQDGQREIVLWESHHCYRDSTEAEDVAMEYCEENELEAELG